MFRGNAIAAAGIGTERALETVAVEFGAFSGEYRFAADRLSAIDALAWVLEDAGEPLIGGGMSIGIDLETTSLGPAEGNIRLCQVAAGRRAVVLDCFAFDAWEVLAGSVAGREPSWIAHNAAFEQSWLARHGGFTLTPMFDTRWVYVRERARRTGVFSGRASALDKVCADLLAFRLSKEQRLSDWTAEPLSPAQIEYAALDALVLIPLREKLERVALESGWTAEIDAANERSAGEARRFL